MYRTLLEQGWKWTDIDESDIYDLLRLLNDEDEEEKPKETESLIAAFMGG